MAKSEIIKLRSEEYASYYREYTEHVSEGNLGEVLNSDRSEISALFNALDEEKSLYRYADDKWSIKEILVHCLDTEIIFNARALMFARGEQNPILGYDHEAYVRQSRADEKKLEEIRAFWEVLRKTTIGLFSGFSDIELNRVGNANGNIMSVNSLVYIIPGHVLHHLGVIREKYGVEF